MLLKTHLVIIIFAILLLISEVEHKLVFVFVALFATLIPDIDTKFSRLGKRRVFRILQFFIKHRGLFHSFSFLILVTLVLVFVLPVVALGFFLGYGLHLFADSFTREGIYPFYPLKKKSRGIISSGGRLEVAIFVLFLILDIGLFLLRVF